MSRLGSPGLLATNIGADDGADVNSAPGAQSLFRAVQAIGVGIAQQDIERRRVEELNTGRAEMINGTEEVMANDNLSPEDKIGLIGEMNKGIMSRFKSASALSQFTVDSARHMARVNQRVKGQVQELKKIEAVNLIDMVDFDSDFNEVSKQIKSMGLDPTAEDQALDSAQMKISKLRRVNLAGVAASATKISDLNMIAAEIDAKHSDFIGNARARLEVFGEAAKAAAALGNEGQADDLLKMLGDSFPVEQARIRASAASSRKKVDRVGEIVGAIQNGVIPMGARLSNDPNHLNSALAAVTSENTRTSELVDAFSTIGLPLPSNLKDQIKGQFNGGDVLEGLAAVEMFRDHNPADAERLIQELGDVASVSVGMNDRQGASVTDLAEGIEALNHPRAVSALAEAKVMMSGDAKRGIEGIDPAASVFELTDFGNSFFKFAPFADENPDVLVATADQNKGIQDQFRLKMLQMAIRDNVSNGDFELIRSAAAKSAAQIYTQNFQAVDTNQGAQLMPKSLLVRDDDLDTFRQGVSRFEVFANNESDGSRVLVNRAFNFGESTFVPAVNDLGQVVSFMRFNRDEGVVRNMSGSANEQGFQKMSRVFNSVIRPGQADLYADVRRRPGEATSAFEAGGEARVAAVVRIAVRNYEIDNGLPPGDDDDDAFQPYLDEATRKSRFKTLMPTDRIRNVNVPE